MIFLCTSLIDCCLQDSVFFRLETKINITETRKGHSQILFNPQNKHDWKLTVDTERAINFGLTSEKFNSITCPNR